MGRIIFCAILIAELCFGQSENFASVILKSNFIRNLSLEFIGNMNLTFEHDIRFGGAKLPVYMWGGTCNIGYQLGPHALIFCGGGYSYTKDLSYPQADFGSSEMKFSNKNLSVLFSYRESNITINTGMDISSVMVLRKDWVVLEPNDTLVEVSIKKTTYVRPMVSVSAQQNLISHLYLKFQMECRVLHFVKFGSKDIDLPKVQPNICIGVGYAFNL
jgi:hypothetical protein